jgi:hypothetical protein
MKLTFNPLDILLLTQLESVDLTDNQPTNMKEITIPTKDACLAVMDYIVNSEMGGHIDETDSWYSTYVLVRELMDDKVDDGEVSYITIDQ